MINVELAEKVIEALRSRGLTLCTAESCTGGNIAHCITEVAGCSDVFMGGVVSYDNSVKHNLLDVSNETLEFYGAVSAQVVTQMLSGACKAVGADCAVATSGIAGPGGGTPEKPVGTVWIGARMPGKAPRVVLEHLPGDRADVIEAATNAALRLLLDMVI